MKKTFCQTKTGTRIHACSETSSRTFCGSKVARRYPNGPGLTHASNFCGACGLNGEYITMMQKACLSMFSAFKK